MGALLMARAPEASAQVVVTVDGDTAYATISLTDDNNVTYEADVTIVFDTPLNLTAQSLNLTAELVDPDAVQGRINQVGCLLFPLVPCVAVDPAFPVMITVEPTVVPWLFTSSFDGDEDGSGNLSFINTYEIEVHTHDLEYTAHSPYRMYKAPVGGVFNDITNDVLQGSMRARGRGAAFSQFLVVSDPRLDLTVVLLKLVDLNARILLAALSDGLRGDLLGMVVQIQALLLFDLNGALDLLDELIALIDAHAGIDIPNVWRAERDLTNDAGEMKSLALTTRFSLARLLGSAAH